MRRAEAIGWKNDARAEHDKEGRKVNEQNGARRRRVEETLIDQDEFDREQRTGGQSEPQRAVAIEKRDTAQPAPGCDQEGRDK